MAVHKLQYSVASGLHGKMYMRADLLFFRHGGYQSIRQILWVRGHKTHALDSVNLAYCSEQRGKIRIIIFAVIGVHVLPKQRYLLHAVRRKIFYLVNYTFNAP